jgi:glycosyltransferase involved in cell wall biosynthesis
VPKSFDCVPPRILVHPADTSAGAYYRSIGPGVALRQTGHALTIASHKYLTDDQLRTLSPDAVVFQRQHEPAQLDAMRRYRKVLGAKTDFLFELDDLLWDVPSDNPAAAQLPADIKSIIRGAIKLCDIIVVSTEPLAKAVKALADGRRIRVVQNFLPLAFIHRAEAGRRSKAKDVHVKPRVGWAGGTSHAGDLALLTDVVKATRDEITWVFMGMVPPGISPHEVEFHPAVKLEDYAAALGELNLDLAVAPLADNHFNECKSNLRLLELGACGYPVIASDIHPFKNSPAVHPADSSAESWIAAIRTLLHDDNHREALSDRMRAWVNDNFVLENKISLWAQGWAPHNGTWFFPCARPQAPLVTLGSDVPGYNRVESFAAAAADAAGAPVLYVRRGTVVTEDQVKRLCAALEGNASVCALSNEGVYPVHGQFINMAPELAEAIDGSADWVNDDQPPTPAPYPIGPVILLSGAALMTIGLPDVERFGDVESAILDWGSRAIEMGKTHVIANNVYAHAAQRIPRTEEAMHKLIDHITAWMPYFGQVTTKYASADPLKAVRERVDLAFNRQNYLGPAQKDPDAAAAHERVLVINGTQEDAEALYKEGKLAFCGTLTGHNLHITYPAMPNVGPLDMRETCADLIEVLSQLAIEKVILRGIGHGTIGAVGYLAAVADQGVPVEYIPSPVAGMYDRKDPNGYVDESGWIATWAKLLLRPNPGVEQPAPEEVTV